MQTLALDRVFDTGLAGLPAPRVIVKYSVMLNRGLPSHGLASIPLQRYCAHEGVLLGLGLVLWTQGAPSIPPDTDFNTSPGLGVVWQHFAAPGRIGLACFAGALYRFRRTHNPMSA